MSNENQDALVAAVSAQVPDVTDEHVAMVLVAWNTIKNGSPLGTIVSDPDTGAIAVRVSDKGVHMWKVTAVDGGTWGDMEPVLKGWTVIKEGTASE